MLGRFFDHVPAGVAGGEIGLGIHAGRIAAQGLLDKAHGFDEFAPVHRFEKSQAANAIADRHLVGRLLLIFPVQQLLDRRAVGGQALLDPGERIGQRRAATVQPSLQLGDKGAGHRRLATGHVGRDQNQLLRLGIGHFQHAVGPMVGQIAIQPITGQPGGDAAQILDQRQAEHDRNRPQLAQFERDDGLIGRARSCGDCLRRSCRRHARSIPGQCRTPGDSRPPTRSIRRGKLLAVHPWKMPAGGADLLFDQIEIIEQPFAGRLQRRGWIAPLR